MKNINIGLIGFVTIGCGVVKLLQNNKKLIEKKLDASLVLKKIVDLDITTPRPVKINKNILTTDVREVLRNDDIDIIIELMGGYEPARTFILEAISHGKQVVTANKALLATHGNEIFNAAEEKKIAIGFEASVGGTIPIIRTLKESLIVNNIKSIYGIMNGTANFILSKMTDEGKDFDVVLKEAQKLGYAEADPTYDIEGIDTAHKLAITLSLAYGCKVNIDDIFREGISSISQQDVIFAKELGYRIKLLAIAILHDDVVEARIHPTMIQTRHLLANVNQNYNAFHLIGDASGPVFLYGQGAGMMPTASAVVSDVIDISRNLLKGVAGCSPLRTQREKTMHDINLMPIDNIETKYYFRFSAVDRPGVLSKISGILGENNISIATVIQKTRQKEGAVPIVMTTYKAMEKNVRRALKIIDKLNIVLDPTIVVRIEDELL
ncbi:MAG: homoserine dehydrogenase [Smithella sp.]